MLFISAGSCTVACILMFFKKPTEQELALKPVKKSIKEMKLSDMFDRRALFPTIIVFFICVSTASITTFIAIHGKNQGVDNISIYFIVSAVVALVTRPSIGKFIDRKGFFLPGLLGMLFVSISLALIGLADSILIFCAAAIFAGIGMGTSMSTMQTMAVSAVPPERRGIATSTYLIGLDIGIAVGATLAGFVATAFGYTIMYLVMACFPLIAGVIFISAGREKIARYSFSEL